MFSVSFDCPMFGMCCDNLANVWDWTLNIWFYVVSWRTDTNWKNFLHWIRNFVDWINWHIVFLSHYFQLNWLVFENQNDFKIVSIHPFLAEIDLNTVLIYLNMEMAHALNVSNKLYVKRKEKISRSPLHSTIL